MTTQSWSSVVDHSSDAGFRAWGSELNTKLTAAGLVNTADTGQINWTTVTRASAGNKAGYEIWRFADSTLYLKIEYGTASGGAGNPGLWITTGTGSNGSGTLTGQLSTTATCHANTAPVSTSTSYTSYIGRTADHLALCWKFNAATGSFPMAFFAVGKTVDNTGAATTTGYSQWTLGGTGLLTLQPVRTTATAVTYNGTTANYVAMPGDQSTALVSGTDPQIFTLWGLTPQVQPWPWGALYLNSDITKQSTVSVALVGTTTRIYLTLGQVGNAGSAGTPITGATSGRVGIAMLYE